MTRKFFTAMSLLIVVFAPAGASANNMRVNTQSHSPARQNVQFHRPIHVDVKPRIHKDIRLHVHCVSEVGYDKFGIPFRKRNCQLGG